MSLSKKQIEDQLLAYHMGWLDRPEMEAVERLIESSPEQADRSRALCEAVEPLADWDTHNDNFEETPARAAERGDRDFVTAALEGMLRRRLAREDRSINISKLG